MKTKMKGAQGKETEIWVLYMMDMNSRRYVEKNLAIRESWEMGTEWRMYRAKWK